MVLGDYKVKKDWIFIADAHLSGTKAEEIDVLLRFLRSEKEGLECLVILGDMFEFFFGFKQSVQNKELSPFSNYYPIFEELKDLYNQGVKIKYFEGNHDFFINSFFLKRFAMDVEVYPDASEENLGGKKAFIAHGDISNQKDYSYRIFRRLLKNRLSYRIIQIAGPKLSCKVAEILNKRSYQKSHSGTPYGVLPAFREFARKKFLEGFEIVILGHSHFPESLEEVIDGKRFYYFNVGPWITQRSFLRYTPPDKFFLSRWEDGQ